MGTDSLLFYLKNSRIPRHKVDFSLSNALSPSFAHWTEMCSDGIEELERESWPVAACTLPFIDGGSFGLDVFDVRVVRIPRNLLDNRGQLVVVSVQPQHIYGNNRLIQHASNGFSHTIAFTRKLSPLKQGRKPLRHIHRDIIMQSVEAGVEVKLGVDNRNDTSELVGSLHLLHILTKLRTINL